MTSLLVIRLGLLYMQFTESHCNEMRLYIKQL